MQMALRGVELMPLERDAFIGPSFIRLLARVCAAVGDIDAALGELERVASLRGPDYLALHDPVWDPLRDEPRFQALANR